MFTEKAMEEPSQQTASPLSKWFNVNAIKKTPPAPSEDPVAKGKIISVEDLERSQKWVQLPEDDCESSTEVDCVFIPLVVVSGQGLPLFLAFWILDRIQQNCSF